MERRKLQKRKNGEEKTVEEKKWRGENCRRERMERRKTVEKKEWIGENCIIKIKIRMRKAAERCKRKRVMHEKER